MSKIVYTDEVILNSIREEQEVVVLVDENTEKYCYSILKERLPAHRLISIQPGEASKSWEVVLQIIDQLISFGATRQMVLVNIGGGVVTDVGGFVAGIYKRGVRFINVPTSLMAMVDASIGGKTGIDFSAYKNMIGLFNEPEWVYIQTDFLQTLPTRELRSGFAEMLKHALIADKNYWHVLKDLNLNGTVNWAPLVKQSAEIKNSLVLIDPFEVNQRKLLNLGHTIGHAVESFSISNNSELLHGEAIAYGLKMEAKIALKTGLLSRHDYDEMVQVLFSFYPDILSQHIEIAALKPYLLNDKKNTGPTINFTLLSAIGVAKINCAFSFSEMLLMLNEYH